MDQLEGTAPYGRLVLDSAEGWWPSATWRALRAIWIAVKKFFGPSFFYRGPPLPPPPYPLRRVFFIIIFFTPIFFIGGPPPIPPRQCPP